MKKFIVLSLFVALFFNAKAQTSFGLKGGFNLASVKIAVAEAGISVSTTNKTSFVIGGYLNHPLTESLSIQPELLLQGMGFKFEGETLNSNYISLPVVFKYAITKAVNVEAGPQIAFLMSAKSMGEDVKDAFKSTDFQLVFGGGINFTNKIQANVRYGIGMSNISASDNSTFGNGIKTKSSALSIGLSYSL
jgi:hypothetical protein